MTALQRLLTLEGEVVKVFKAYDGRILVWYEDGYIKCGCQLVGEYGEGDTPEDAAEDYLAKVSGQKLVFHPTSSARKEVFVLR